MNVAATLERPATDITEVTRMLSQRTCSVPDCERPYRCSGYCRMHYARMLTKGTTEGRKSEAQRFWEKVEKTDGCWNWTAHLSSAGYGRFGVGGRSGTMEYAHRWAYSNIIGPIPVGLDLDHLCRNGACVNPSHLEPVTRAENLRRSELVVSSINALKTCCPRGHEFTAENTYRNVDGYRQCNTCRREYSKAKTR